MTHASTPELLTLHAVRLLGVANDEAVASRFALDPAVVKELLLDDQAFGWISWSAFAGIGGWSLTDSGRAENERALKAELGDGEATVRQVYAEFLPLNARLQTACTQWQLRPTADDPLAFNDHTDRAWDQQVLDELADLADHLDPLSNNLEAILDRFQGYHARFTAALDRARAGDPAWIDQTGVDSCHKVWFELHEDLIATLNESRAT
ncbi:transcriptional regulator [Kribbella sp. NPDC050124]|uniref:transcriptional regulator n=1 Tax=Kribbella sp. NPDC050124 TaxID=3364114 RepID=UPI003796B018